MDPLTQYILPIGGMELGIHRYRFIVDASFLTQFEESPYDEASIQVDVEVDRQSNLIALDFSLHGTVACSCDRCTAFINLPVKLKHSVYLRSKKDISNVADDDVIFIEPDASSYSVAQILYDLFLLAIPLQKTYDCQDEMDRPCDEAVLERLEGESMNEKGNGSSSIWDGIKAELNKQ